MIVLDSSAIIDLFLGTELGKKVKAKIGQESIAVTSISVHEVLVGYKDKEVVTNFFKSVTVISFDEQASYKSCELDEVLKKKGKPIAKLDLFIASICMHHNLSLITTDKDFKEVEGLTFIHIV